MTYTEMTKQLQAKLPDLLTVLPSAMIVLVGAIAIRLALSRGFNLMTDRTRITHSEMALVRKAVNWLILTITIILLLGIFGFNLGGLWTVLSTLLAMVAIGFVAVWSVLSNVSCTFMILLFRPFAVGDQIEFAGEEVSGRVVDLNLLYTTLQTRENSTLQVPNNLFFQKVLTRRKGTSDTSLVEQLRASDQAES